MSAAKKSEWEDTRDINLVGKKHWSPSNMEIPSNILKGLKTKKKNYGN